MFIFPISFIKSASGGLAPEAFVTEWTIPALGDATARTIKLPHWDGSVAGGSTLDYDVDWGDGSSDSNVTTVDKTHEYPSSDEIETYQVVITGSFLCLNMARADSVTQQGYLTNMVQWGTDNVWSSLYRMFHSCKSMDYTATDFPNLTNLAEKSDAREMFYDCESVVNLDLSNWTNTANITYLYYTFGKTDALKTLNLTGWDVSNVGYAVNCCGYAGDLVDGCEFIMPDLEWGTGGSALTSFFFNAKVKSLDVSGWDFAASTSLGAFFRNTQKGSGGVAYSIDASGWQNSSNITSLSNFARDTQATSINISGIDTQNITDMNYAFYYAIELTHITGLDEFDATSLNTALIMFQYTKKYNWDTANANFGADWGPNLGNITNMVSLFYGTGDTTPGTGPPDVSNWDVSNVTDMSQMFRQAKWSGDESIDVSSWDVSSVTGTGFTNFMRQSEGIGVLDTSNWQISSSVTSMSSFAYYSQLAGDVDFSHANCDLSGITTWVNAYQATGIIGFKLHGSSSFAAVTSMTNFIYAGTTLVPKADYDALLLRLAATATNTLVTLTVSNSNYTLGGAVEIARDTTLKAGRSWTINDDGGV
jgi:surface protein